MLGPATCSVLGRAHLQPAAALPPPTPFFRALELGFPPQSPPPAALQSDVWQVLNLQTYFLLGQWGSVLLWQGTQAAERHLCHRRIISAAAPQFWERRPRAFQPGASRQSCPSAPGILCCSHFGAQPAQLLLCEASLTCFSRRPVLSTPPLRGPLRPKTLVGQSAVTWAACCAKRGLRLASLCARPARGRSLREAQRCAGGPRLAAGLPRPPRPRGAPAPPRLASPPLILSAGGGEARRGPALGPPLGRGVSPRPASRGRRGRGGAGRGGRGPAPTGCRAPGSPGSVRGGGGGGGGAGSWRRAVLLRPAHGRTAEPTAGGTRRRRWASGP